MPAACTSLAARVGAGGVIDHPNIVAIYEAGAIADMSFHRHALVEAGPIPLRCVVPTGHALRPPAIQAGFVLAGISGHGRLRAAVPMRDVRVMKKTPTVGSASTGNRTRRFAGLSCEKNGSDGTRIRDLRRDSPREASND
jgi:hypothetical protein